MSAPLPDRLAERAERRARVVRVTVTREAEIVVPDDLPIDAIQRLAAAQALPVVAVHVHDALALAGPDTLWLADDYRHVQREPAAWAGGGS